MQEKKYLMLSIAGIVLVVILAIVAITVRRSAVVPGGEKQGQVLSGTQAPGEVSTRQAAPADVKVPELNASGTSANVGVPQVAVGSSRDAASSARYRSFDVKVEGNAFAPDTVIVNQGDTVRINLLAVDKDYEFIQPELGYNFPLLKGKSQPLAFSATSAGDFLFYCASCGGPSSGPKGHIIIAPKK
ncbi:MAG: cupredoxin domain-containing protein [Candidatus Liptonbacteria bacterium]|nr:cupredoxin domain-containing protein [Candidatus Liptonbacteria bacterium]